MSTLLYETLTHDREQETANQSTQPDKKPGVGLLVDSLVAIVPVEVLAGHAALMSVVSETTDTGVSGATTVKITDPTWASRFWVFLIIAALLLYAVPHLLRTRRFDPADLIRMFIPPAAFAVWTMLQKGSLFDAVAAWDDLTRTGLAVFFAIGLLAISKGLAKTADQAAPK